VKNNKLIILSIITAIMAISAVFVVKSQYKNDEPVVYGKFLKQLQGNVEKVANVVIIQKNKQFQVVASDNGWIFPAKNNYPVEITTIRNLILGAATLEILEKKTDNPENLEGLGLKEPADEKSESLRIIFTDSSGEKKFADFIRGSSKTTLKAADIIPVYVRNTAENQAWLVQGEYSIKLDPNSLFNKNVYKISKNLIKQATIAHPKGDHFVLSRPDITRDFSISNSPKKAKDTNHINNIATILDGGLIFIDVAPASTKKFDDKTATTALFETYDGLKVTIKLTSENGEKWVSLNAEALDDRKKTEVDAINSVAKDWVYRVSDASGDMLLSNLAQLVE
jgi:hypothetical protein